MRVHGILWNFFLKLNLLLVLVVCIAFRSYSQQEKPQNTRFIQLTGLILTSDSTKSIPYATVRVKGTNRGITATLNGFFSIVVKETDQVEITSIGFKKKTLSIPPNLPEPKYTTIITVQPDTLTLKTVNIYPWPTRDKFKDAFIKTHVDKTYEDLAKENMSPQRIRTILINMKMDGSENQKYTMNQWAGLASYGGGQMNYGWVPGMKFPFPLSITNPFNWAQLISDIKSGKFSNYSSSDQ